MSRGAPNGNVTPLLVGFLQDFSNRAFHYVMSE